MKIAVTTEGNQIYQHFGKCPTFTRNLVEGAGIRLYSGITGPIDAAVSALLAGQLRDQGGSCGHHHEGGHDCSCGHHHAGGHDGEHGRHHGHE